MTIIGLTGRTGSGCSTVAYLLRSQMRDIHNSLFAGTDPSTSEQRKEQIIRRHFEKKWVPFRQIQVRSIITTFLCDLTETQLEQGFGTVLPANEHVSDCRSLLAQLRVRYDQAKTAALADRVLFYDSILPEETQKLRELLKESNFARLY